jgi:hypothetical protein
MAWRGVAVCVQGLSDEDIANELAPAPEDPTPLSQEEEEERATLLREGFSNWNRRDFQVGRGLMSGLCCNGHLRAAVELAVQE